jgi:hypothetical protein
LSTIILFTLSAILDIFNALLSLFFLTSKNYLLFFISFALSATLI